MHASRINEMRAGLTPSPLIYRLCCPFENSEIIIWIKGPIDSDNLERNLNYQDIIYS